MARIRDLITGHWWEDTQDGDVSIVSINTAALAADTSLLRAAVNGSIKAPHPLAVGSPVALSIPIGSLEIGLSFRGEIIGMSEKAIGVRLEGISGEHRKLIDRYLKQL